MNSLISIFKASKADNEQASNHFFFVSFEYLDKNKNEVVLLVFPNYLEKDVFTEEDIRYSVVYKRPKTFKAGMLTRLFTGKKMKLKKEGFTNTEHITKLEIQEIIKQFLEVENEWLDQKIRTPGYDIPHYN